MIQEEHFALKMTGEIYGSPEGNAVGATVIKCHRKKQAQAQAKSRWLSGFGVRRQFS